MLGTLRAIVIILVVFYISTGVAYRGVSAPTRVIRDFAMQQLDPTDIVAAGAASFLEGLAQVAKNSVQAAGDAADTWINSGWQVKKRVGHILPEIRPSYAKSLSENTVSFLPPMSNVDNVADTTAVTRSTSGSSELVNPSDAALQVLSSVFVYQNPPLPPPSYRHPTTSPNARFTSPSFPHLMFRNTHNSARLPAQPTTEAPNHYTHTGLHILPHDKPDTTNLPTEATHQPDPTNSRNYQKAEATTPKLTVCVPRPNRQSTHAPTH